MRLSTVFLLFAILSSSLLLALQAVPICILNDNDNVDAVNPVVVDSEPQIMRLGALEFNHTVILLNDSENLAEWTTVLDQCAAFIVPELENGKLLPTTFAGRDPIISLIQGWTAQGGLFISAGGPNNVEFIKDVFGAPYDFGPDLFSGEIDLNRTAVGASLRPFSREDSPDHLTDWDATLTLTDVPAEQCMYQGDVAPNCALSFARYASFGNDTQIVPNEVGGGVMYMGWDFWNAFPNGTVDGEQWVPLLFRQVIDDDCNNNTIVDSLEPDCNANGITDACELSSELDCNENQILDECELTPQLDCNNNTRLDACELNDQTDCDDNGKLDECENPPPSCSESSDPGNTNDGDGDGATSETSGTASETSGDGDGDLGDGQTSSASAVRGWIVFF